VTRRLEQLREFEGRLVTLVLKDGTRIDRCRLLAAGRTGASSLWVLANGMDVFVPASLVADLWEVVVPDGRKAA
jgi:hypothetical protein